MTVCDYCGLPINGEVYTYNVYYPTYSYHSTACASCRQVIEMGLGDPDDFIQPNA